VRAGPAAAPPLTRARAGHAGRQRSLLHHTPTHLKQHLPFHVVVSFDGSLAMPQTGTLPPDPPNWATALPEGTNRNAAAGSSRQDSSDSEQAEPDHAPTPVELADAAIHIGSLARRLPRPSLSLGADSRARGGRGAR
jgi:hypothetical protein